VSGVDDWELQKESQQGGAIDLLPHGFAQHHDARLIFYPWCSDGLTQLAQHQGKTRYRIRCFVCAADLLRACAYIQVGTATSQHNGVEGSTNVWCLKRAMNVDKQTWLVHTCAYSCAHPGQVDEEHHLIHSYCTHIAHALMPSLAKKIGLWLA
jgi:hypothetical protein